MKGSRPIFDSFREASECARTIATTTGYETVVIRHDENWTVQLQRPSSPDESQSGVLENDIQYEQSSSDIIYPNHEIDTLKLRIDPTLQHKVDFESYEAATEYAKSTAIEHQCYIEVRRNGSGWVAKNPIIEPPIEDEPNDPWSVFLYDDEPKTLIEKIASRRNQNSFYDEFDTEFREPPESDDGYSDDYHRSSEEGWYYTDDDNDPWD